MPTEYVVIRERPAGVVEQNEGGSVVFAEVSRETANTAEQAERRVADKLSDAELEAGVSLRAVPVRNWDGSRNTFKADTRRRLLRS